MEGGNISVPDGEDKMWKKVIVPIDDSLHSYRALKFAASLAENIGAVLVLLHVYRI